MQNRGPRRRPACSPRMEVFEMNDITTPASTDRHALQFRNRMIQERLAELDKALDPFDEAISGQHAVDRETQLRYSRLPGEIRAMAVERRGLRTELGDIQRIL